MSRCRHDSGRPDNFGADLIDQARAFCLNVLTEDQEAIAKRFAGIDGSDRSERYGLGDWTHLSTGAPVLVDAMVSFDCRVVQQFAVGTHTVFIGHISAMALGGRGRPLMYGVGKFVGLELGI